MGSIYEKMTSGVYIIAEMSANHGGKLETALFLVEEAKRIGADCLKIQTYTADTITIPCDNDYFKIRGGLWDGYILHDLYKEAFTPWEWHKAIKDKCEEVGIDFLSTPFDSTAVDFLDELGVEFFKVASFELVDIPLIEYIAQKGKPIVMSCGMASEEEIQEAVDACRRHNNNQVVLLKCCSQYPANPEDMNLAVIKDMQRRFNLPIGLSDHSLGSLAPVIAVSLGAKVIEKHICISRDQESVDAGFSMPVAEFESMIQDIRTAKIALGEETYQLTPQEKKGLNGRRSLFAVKPIAKGEAFTPENVRSIRPGNGIKPKYYKALMTKTSKNSYGYGEPILMDEVE